MRYLSGTPTKTDRTGDPDFLDFTLVNTDVGFARLKRGDYITINSPAVNGYGAMFYGSDAFGSPTASPSYGTWFSGYLTQEPDFDYLGKDSVTKLPMWSFKYRATSDDVILNQRALGILPPFVNMTMGAILKALAALLAPGMFDVTGVQNGLTLARYVPDPKKKFSDVVDDFCKIARYRFRAANHALSFVPMDLGTAPLVVDGTDKHFTPSRLGLKSSADQIINEAVVLGDIEPQNFITEYFLGDGITPKFPLISSVFGVESTLLLDDDFSGSVIDTSKWTVYDTVNNWIRVSNGFLNFVGGNANNTYDVHLDSASLVALAGNLRITHGDYDFVNAGANSTVQGVVAGLWTQAPNSGFTGCVYGLRVNRDAAGVTTLSPVVNGSVDATQSLTVDFTKRYVMRTVLNFDRVYRMTQQANYISATGAVQSYGAGFVDSDLLTATTYITEIDPTTAAISANFPKVMTNNLGLTTGQLFATYVPGASNDLHCTITNVTVSMPMQASLSVRSKGSAAFVDKLVGPNEVDSFDGMAPVATINQSGGQQQKQSILGTRKYNAGDPELVYFKDTANLTTTTPGVGDLVKLNYRRAGAAVAVVRNSSSIAGEASAWGDSGIRSAAYTDLSPSPRTTADCETAAAAIVGEGSYQHFEGTYSVWSDHVVAEPQAGMLLPFQNLPAATFGVTGFTEPIYEVQTTLESTRNGDRFLHNVQFGRNSENAKLQRELTRFTKQTDVFAPQDSAEIPQFVPAASIGNTFVPDITNLSLDLTAPHTYGVDATSIYLNTNQAPPTGGGFEVRYTDESWGADDGKNLVTRTASQTFTIPRTQRGKIVFVKPYDARNKLKWSEDLTQWGKSAGTTVTTSTGVNPNGDLSQISTVTWPTPATGAFIVQSTSVTDTGLTGTFTLWFKGTAGNKVIIQVNNTGGDGEASLGNRLVTFTGNWQQESVTVSGAAHTGAFKMNILPNGATAITFSVTQASFELASAQTVYCKTNSTVYGVNSRYAAGLCLHAPLVPTAPTATIDYSDAVNPKVTVVMPTLMNDVWGVEVRKSDNTTVLYKSDLIDATFNPTVTDANNASRSLSYYVYAYNLLGEYSPAYNATLTIPTPTITAPTVDDPTKMVKWSVATGASVETYTVEVATDAAYTNKVITTTTTDPFWQLGDTDFFNQRYIRITPNDGLGAGTPNTVSHVYTPTGLTEFNANEVVTVTAPSTPTSNPTVPTPVQRWAQDYISESWSNFAKNRLVK
jgi:hypothetical protein